MQQVGRPGRRGGLGSWTDQRAYELTHPAPATVIALASSMASALSITQTFDSLAIRVNGPRAWGEKLSILWTFTDLGETYRMELSNGAPIHHAEPKNTSAELALTLTKPQLLALLAGGSPDGIGHEGDMAVLARPALASTLFAAPEAVHRTCHADAIDLLAAG